MPSKKPRLITEKEFSQTVVDLARLCGWKVARWPTWRPTGTDPGVPDLLMARNGSIVFAELKAENGKVTSAQAEWLRALRGDVENRVSIFVWLPSDWSHIQEDLR